MGGLVVLAISVTRRGRAVQPEASSPRARGAGLLFGGIAMIGMGLQLAWIVKHTDVVRPLVAGATAPPFALQQIGLGGQLGDRVSVTPGKVTILDFWATWCGPCLAAMPRVDAFARSHPEVEVIAINLDDPAKARALFDARHWSPILVADDGETANRFGVTTIPHTVMIDAQGRVGDGLKLLNLRSGTP
jgi:thiol-disulfide isomerase/thioredoxin